MNAQTVELVSSYGYRNLGHITVTDAQLRDNAALLKAIQGALPNATRVTVGRSLLNKKSNARPVIWVFLRAEEQARAIEQPQAPQVVLSTTGQQAAKLPPVQPKVQPKVTPVQVQANTRTDNTKVRVPASKLTTNRTLSPYQKRTLTQLRKLNPALTEAQARALVVGR